MLGPEGAAARATALPARRRASRRRARAACRGRSRRRSGAARRRGRRPGARRRRCTAAARGPRPCGRRRSPPAAARGSSAARTRRRCGCRRCGGSRARDRGARGRPRCPGPGFRARRGPPASRPRTTGRRRPRGRRPPGWLRTPSRDHRRSAASTCSLAPMRLATFAHPGTGEPTAGEVRGDEVVAFADGTVADRLASGDRTPADGRRASRSPASTLLAPVARRARSSASASTTPRTPRETGRRPARDADRLHEAAVLQPRAQRRRRAARRRSGGAWTTRASWRSCMGAGNEIAGYAVADDLSARDLQGREPQWTRAKGFDNSCPWGPWITTADEVADPRGAAPHDARQRRAAPGLADVGPRLRPAGSSWTSSPRRSRSSPAT